MGVSKTIATGAMLCVLIASGMAANPCAPDCTNLHGSFPNPQDCTKYFQCAQGFAVPRNCPDGLYFNPTYGICDYPEEAGCVADPGYDCSGTTAAPTTEAPAETTAAPVDTTAAPVETTTGAIDTTEGEVDTTEGDVDTTVGDVDTTEGDVDTTEGDVDTTEGDVDTTEGDVDTTEGDVDTTEGDVETTEVDEETTEGDVETTEGDVETTEGDVETTEVDIDTTEGDVETTEILPTDVDVETTEEDVETTQGDVETTEGDAETTAAPTTAAPETTIGECIPECPSSDAIFANPRDCGSFFKCSHGEPSLFQCYPGLYFNPTNERCDFPENVNCTATPDAPCVAVTAYPMA